MTSTCERRNETEAWLQFCTLSLLALNGKANNSVICFNNLVGDDLVSFSLVLEYFGYVQGVFSRDGVVCLQKPILR